MEAVTAACCRGEQGQGAGEETGRKGEQWWVGVVDGWREKDEGKGDGWKEGGGYEVCTRLSAPGVPCGPGSGVREG